MWGRNYLIFRSRFFFLGKVGNRAGCRVDSFLSFCDTSWVIRLLQNYVVGLVYSVVLLLLPFVRTFFFLYIFLPRLMCASVWEKKFGILKIKYLATFLKRFLPSSQWASESCFKMLGCCCKFEVFEWSMCASVWKESFDISQIKHLDTFLF